MTLTPEEIEKKEIAKRKKVAKENFSNRFRHLLRKLAQDGFIGSGFKEHLNVWDYVSESQIVTFFDAKASKSWTNIKKTADTNYDENVPVLTVVLIHIAPKLKEVYKDSRGDLAILYLLGQFEPDDTELLWLNMPLHSFESSYNRIQPPDITSPIRWERSSEAIDWINSKDYMLDTFKPIRQGVQLFEGALLGDPISKLRDKYDLSEKEASKYMRQALFGNYVQLTHVRRNTALEDELLTKTWSLDNGTKYKLKEVIVAHCSFDDKNSKKYIDSTLIRTELVAFLLAQYLHKLVKDIKVPIIGVSRGYTLERFACCSKPSGDTESIIWTPLHVSSIPSQQDLSNREGHIADPRSANGIVCLLASRHPASQPLYLPFPDKDIRETIKGKNNLTTTNLSGKGLLWQASYCYEVLRRAENADIIITSTSGVPNEDGNVMPASDDTEYRFNETSDLIENEILNKPEIKAKFAGTILGNIIDKDGQYLSEAIREKNELLKFSVNLDTLRKLVQDNKQCWMLSGGKHKALGTLTALRSGLINRACVDEEIAQYLLDLAD